jgi:hypothetical protein
MLSPIEDPHEVVRVVGPDAAHEHAHGASVGAHLDALEERVRRWAEWFRDRIREGKDEAQIVPLFADYEHNDLREGGATNEIVDDYEAADPSFMAVPAALRYWRKYGGAGSPSPI